MRLGKQRVECLQILNALRRGTGGWIHHPATRMWRGYEDCLCLYASIICTEWKFRGMEDNLLRKFKHPRYGLTPPWLGDRNFHRSHQSNLVRKNGLWYGKLFNGIRNDLPYIWPQEKG